MGVISWGEICIVYLVIIKIRFFYVNRKKQQAIRYQKMPGSDANNLKMPCSDLKTVCAWPYRLYGFFSYISYSFVPGRGHSAS